MCREQKNKGHRGAQVMLANANEPSNGFLVTHGYECQLQQDSPLNPTDESRNPQHSEKQEQSKVLAEVKKQSESFSMLTNLSQDDRRQEGALQLQNQARLCPELETSLLQTRETICKKFGLKLSRNIRTNNSQILTVTGREKKKVTDQGWPCGYICRCASMRISALSDICQIQRDICAAYFRQASYPHPHGHPYHIQSKNIHVRLFHY